MLEHKSCRLASECKEGVGNGAFLHFATGINAVVYACFLMLKAALYRTICPYAYLLSHSSDGSQGFVTASEQQPITEKGCF